MSKPHEFSYTGKTGIANADEFAKKRLADFSCNIGCVCRNLCSYCYVHSFIRKYLPVREVLAQGHCMKNFSLYREAGDTQAMIKSSLLDKQGRLRKKFRGNTGVVIMCTTVDPVSSPQDIDTTAECIELILSLTQLHVRVLAKNVGIRTLANRLARHRERIVYGLSTGTLSDDVSGAVELYCSSASARIAALRSLQDDGFRCFGMLCPVLPGEMPRFAQLVESIRPERCENVWVEPINPRGDSFEATMTALSSAGLESDAAALRRICNSTSHWKDYCKQLFAHAHACIPQPDKLRFLQYTSRGGTDFEAWFRARQDQGALVL